MNLNIIILIFVATVLEHQRIETFLDHRRSYYSGIRTWELMRPRTFEEPNGNINILPDIINPKFTSARNCAVAACKSCMLKISNKLLTNNKKVNPLSEKEGALSHNKIEVGDLFQLIIFL